MATTILLVDSNLQPVGLPVTDWTHWELEQRVNAAGAGQFSAPVTDDLLDSLAIQDVMVVVVRPGQSWIGGPVEKPGDYTISAGAGRGLVTVGFSTWEALLGERVTYPDPAAAATAQTVDTYSVTSTNAETVLRNLVNLNAGPGALFARRIPTLSVAAPVGGIGTNVTFTTRFEPLLDALRAVATAGGGLGWRVAHTGSGLQFQVYAPQDKSASVRFGLRMGNVTEIKVSSETATVSAALVAGQGEGASRVIAERTTSGWRRVEKFVDQRFAADTAELDQAGDVSLVEGAGTAKVSLAPTAVDIPTQRYGSAYRLGDKVAVELRPGVEVAEVVRAVQISQDADGPEVVAPLIGPEGVSADEALVAAWRDLSRRVSRAERR